jgi:hypothetical protein
MFRSRLSGSINKTATCSELFSKCACAYDFEKKSAGSVTQNVEKFVLAWWF